MSTAVLLMAYGAAATLEDIPAYLQDIRGGRPAPPELIAAVRERYEKMGGKSPLLEITQAQARALEKRIGLKVYLGMRHSEPTMQQAVESIVHDGHDCVAALPATPFYSNMSIGAYYKKLRQALGTQKLRMIEVEPWNDHPALIEAWSRKLKEALDRFGKNAKIDVLFTAHSLPKKIVEEGDPYPEELRKTIEAVAYRSDLKSCKFAYQSRGATAEPWLGPDAADVIKASPAKNLLLVPIGFISDHMETLYDDDILYRELAESLGKRFMRVPSLNDDPLLIEAMGDAVTSAIRP